MIRKKKKEREKAKRAELGISNPWGGNNHNTDNVSLAQLGLTDSATSVVRKVRKRTTKGVDVVTVARHDSTVRDDHVCRTDCRQRVDVQVAGAVALDAEDEALAFSGLVLVGACGRVGVEETI